MTTQSRILVFLTMAAVVSAAMAQPPLHDNKLPPLDFNRDIRPILSKNCFSCHGSDEKKRSAGLRLDQRDSATTARKDRPAAILPGKAAESELIQRIVSDDETDRMPPVDSGLQLAREQIDKLKRWITEGAKYSQHWAFVAPVKPILPAVKRHDWTKQPLDNYILARLELAGMQPAIEADKYTLLRRLSLDLRGLPPSLSEIRAFEQDQSTDAYEKMVNRFLADPAYGERWARVWLDLARYADSAGYGSDPLRLNMWRYRDWVIDSFNMNMPYDQFTIEQLAGDLLPAPTLQQKMATAFHRNTMTNTEGGTDREEFRVAAVKDRVNTTMQVWMGLTMGCAQCHSHKYDPITQKEYYQAYAIFNNTADNDQPNEAPTMPAPTEEQIKRNKDLDDQIAAVRKKLDTPTMMLAMEQWAWQSTLKSTAPWITIDPVRQRNDTLTLKPSASRITGLRLVPRIVSSPWHGKPALKVNAVTASIQPADARPPQAHFVRVTLPGKNRILSLAEVEVYQGDENIARFGDASQSSLDFKGDAARAIDGNTNGDFFAAGSVTHTQTETDPWWEVKLPGCTTIDRIVLWNRTGGVEQRLKGANIQLLDVNHNAIWEQPIAEVPMPRLEIDTIGRRLEISKPISSKLDPAPPVQLVFKQPVEFHGNELLQLKFDQKGHAQHSMVQVTVDTRLAARRAIPAHILTLVDKSRGNLTQDEQNQLAAYYRSIAPSLKPQREEIARLEKSRPTISSLPVMIELTDKQRRTTKLLKKGNFLDPGDEVNPSVPALFQPSELNASQAMNRLDLAKWLLNRENPLTARVAVNRIWAQLFGVGLVESEEDFGTQGELPSHPELLDYLAWQYQHQLKWDTRALIKMLVMSATYRQNSKVTPEHLGKDPNNRLLSRGPRYRLEAEMVRDQALALSGLLNRKVGGPSVFPRQPDGLWQAAFNGERTWMTSRGDDRYRRGLYTFWRRTIPYPSMAAFDAPSRETCQVRRVRSNTPIQAFVTLNDPVYVEAAQALARRIIKEGGWTTDERLRYALKLCTGRPVDNKQLKTLVELYKREKARYCRNLDAARKLATEPLGPLPNGWKADEAATWTVIANVLLNLDAVLMKG